MKNARLNYQNAKTAYEAVSGGKQSAKRCRDHHSINRLSQNISVKDGEYVTAGQAIATRITKIKLVLRADVSEKYYNSLNSINNANFKLLTIIAYMLLPGFIREITIRR